MSDRSAPAATLRSQSLDVATMQAVAAEVLAPDAYPRHDEMEDLRLLLRRHLNELIPAVEAIARTKPAESVPREVALAEAESARVLLTIGFEPGIRGAIQHVKHLARELRALCDQHDILTGVRLLGAV